LRYRPGLGLASGVPRRRNRSWAMLRASSRDTCICEIPRRVAISDWGRPSKKRMWRMRRSRGGSWANNGEAWPGSRRPRVTGPRRRYEWPGSHPLVTGGGVQGGGAVRLPASSASKTSSSDTFTSVANSAMVGERPSSWPTWPELCRASGTAPASFSVPDSPALVPEMAFQLADDGVGGVSRETRRRVRGRRRSLPPSGGRRCHLHEVVQGSPRLANRRASTRPRPMWARPTAHGRPASRPWA